MGILRTRMEQDLIVRGRSVHTRRAYLRAVRELARYYHRSPDELTDHEVRAYLCHLIEERRLAAARAVKRWARCASSMRSRLGARAASSPSPWRRRRRSCPRSSALRKWHDWHASAPRTRRVNWVLDADIRGFFDTLDHGWLVKFVEHRIGDRRIVRLIQKWLKAGVLAEGQRIRSEQGTVQGGSISPLLANIYLHYVFDLWTQRWRKKQARGDVVMVRYADDFVVGFEHREEAERFLAQLRQRLEPFGLELHPDKTRLLRFGRRADRQWRNGRGEKPGTFNFLGFTHSGGKTRKGGFTVLRQTMRMRVQAKLRELKDELRRRMHDPVPEQGAFLRSVVRGHVHYYGVPMNGWAISAFRRAVGRLWFRTLRRRSQTHRLRWERMQRLIRLCLPPARVCYPYPLQRFGVLTQGRSPVR